MNDSTDKHESIRQEIEAWLDANWDSEKYLAEPSQDPKAVFGPSAWLEKLLPSGYAVPTWSSDWYGRGFTSEQAKVVEAVFRQRKVPGVSQDRKNLGAVTVYHQGSDELKQELLPDMLTNGMVSCLLYSEPNAGSDLAAVRTRADRDGDDYVITGQKVWTSHANQARYGVLLARTDWDAPKHKGLTFFVLPMEQSGVEVRPINQITGESEFFEVFFDQARVPARYIVGELNDGWGVLQTALAYERMIMGEGLAQRGGSKLGKRGYLIELAQRNHKQDDPVLRQQIAQNMAYRQLNELNMKRARAEILQHGSSSLMSLGKLAMSRVQHGEARVQANILGAASLLDGEQFSDAANANFDAAKAYMNSIGGGSDQIQRNIISERILGLPREQEGDKTAPFKDVKFS